MNHSQLSVSLATKKQPESQSEDTQTTSGQAKNPRIRASANQNMQQQL